MKITKWNIDSTNSEATFKVKKLLITNVTGKFENFEGQAETETEVFESIRRICFKAAISSIKTDDAKRDEHLRSADFFNMEKYPDLRFVAENISRKEKQIEVYLKIKNITKSIYLNVDFGETIVDESGSEKVQIYFSGKINRKVFGLVWDGKNEVGNRIVGDEIKLSARIEFVKQMQLAEVEPLECII